MVDEKANTPEEEFTAEQDTLESEELKSDEETLNENEVLDEDFEAEEVDEVHNELTAQVADLSDKLLRTQADYQNFMRRSRDELQREKVRAKGDVIRAMIPLIDHFDMALGNVPDEDGAKAVAQGVEMIKSEFIRAFESTGVSLITPEVGEEFTPGTHEAVMQQPAEGIEKNHITLALQPGYRYGDLVLRPAKVAVAP